MNYQSIKLNLSPIIENENGKKEPFIIAGPCSAESESQLLRTARRISDNSRVSMLRAGAWKPRTRPDCFEGIGAESLRWLKTAREETGLPTAVEVANAGHVHEALKYGVDAVWIGARTTVNPFSVQEIADALKGSDVTVFVKNPVSPDLQLWIGAFERLNSAGITKLGAVHRGFASASKGIYRNQPIWEIPIALKRCVPDLPLICDPSHIAGSREHIFDISQTAIDLAMDGLMIECHISPASALSDKAQQLTPRSLETLLNKLCFRSLDGNNCHATSELEQLRREIDNIDSDLLALISRRAEIAGHIGEFKKNHNMTILQVRRFEDMIKKRLKQSAALGLDINAVRKIYETLHHQSISIQSKIMK